MSVQLPRGLDNNYVSDDSSSEESSDSLVEKSISILKKYTDLLLELKEEREKKRIIVEKYEIIKKNYMNEKCAICKDVVGVKVVIDCKHMFHKECISKWKEGTCPLCRNKMTYELFEFETKVALYEHKVI